MKIDPFSLVLTSDDSARSPAKGDHLKHGSMVYEVIRVPSDDGVIEAEWRAGRAHAWYDD